MGTARRLVRRAVRGAVGLLIVHGLVKALSACRARCRELEEALAAREEELKARQEAPSKEK